MATLCDQSVLRKPKKISITVRKHVCGVNQLHYYFKRFFELSLYLSPLFSLVRALPEQVRQQQRPIFFSF